MSKREFKRKRRVGGSKYYPDKRTGKVEIQRKIVPSNSQLQKKIVKIQKSNELSWLEQFGSFSVTDAKTPVGSTTLLHANPVAAGDTPQNRTGNRIRSTSLFFRARIQMPAADLVFTPPLVRIFVFWDRQPNQAPPELYGNSDAAGLFITSIVTDPVFAMRNINNQMRYTILYDKVHTVHNYTGVTAAGNYPAHNNYLIKKKIKLNRIVQFDGSPSDISTYSSNALWIGMVSTAASGAPTHVPIVTIAWRHYWKEY